MTPLSMVVSFLSSVEGLEVTPYVVPHRLLGQGFLQQGIERSQLLRREFGQRQRQVIGNAILVMVSFTYMRNEADCILRTLQLLRSFSSQ
jgi:hypothetical protein